jgi:quercetin dioxygenase-like cupin family protein
MDDIWVRYNHASKIGAGFNDEHSSVWYPVIDKIPEILPVCMKIMSAAQGERLGGVLITKLAPGKRIEPHVDRGWHAEYYQKYFVPIKNGKGAKFCWEDIEIDPRPGEVWEFDNSVTHWVENSSSEDRIAMIVCVKKVGSSLDECRREV